jgi:predicted dehydrogenase
MAHAPLRVGIIGANWSLKVHGTAWRLLPDVEVAAVCTAHRETAEAAAQAFGLAKA